MEHHFNVEIAKIYGIDIATFMYNIVYWVVFNKNENINYHEGRFWTFNKIKSFPEHFPYWSHKQVERLINKCVSEGLLIRSTFNKTKYDRTCWYSLTDLTCKILNIDISRNREMEIPKSVHPFPEIGTPIPNNKTQIINTDIKDKEVQRKKRVAFDPQNIDLPNWLQKELWIDFVQHRISIKKPLTELAAKKTINLLTKMKEGGQDIEIIINTSIANGWQGLFEIKSQRGSYGKDSKYHGQNGKFDATQYLLDSIRLDESKESNSLPESGVPFQNCEYLQYNGTGGDCY